MITLGGLEFDGFELPESINIGGKQTLVSHKVIGGRVVVDAMGPDDEAISWSGRFLGETAELRVYQLDLLRRSGREVALAFSIRHYRVVISSFTAKLERPYLYSYDITCEVIEDQISGSGGKDSASIEQEVAADLAAAEAYAAERDAMLYKISLASMAVRAAMGDRGALRGIGQIALAEAQGAVGEAIFTAGGSAFAANTAVAAVTAVGGVIAGGNPAQMALGFLGTTASVEAANSAGLAAAHMTRVQTNIAQAPP